MNPTTKSTGYVYFIRAIGVNKVKIGYSVSPKWRLATLQTGSPLPLEMFGLCPGTPSTESDFHAKYANFHSHGEWFDLPEKEVNFLADRYGIAPIKAREERPPITEDGKHLLMVLELSHALIMCMEAGMIKPTVTKENLWAFRLEFCPQHQMVLLPTCLGCGNPTT